MKLVNLRQLESKLMWSSITAAVKSKMAVESKATHMGLKAIMEPKVMLKVGGANGCCGSTGQKVVNTE